MYCRAKFEEKKLFNDLDEVKGDLQNTRKKKETTCSCSSVMRPDRLLVPSNVQLVFELHHSAKPLPNVENESKQIAALNHSKKTLQKKYLFFHFASHSHSK